MENYTEKDVTIVITTFNSSHAIKDCLNAIDKNISNIIIVDNNSDDKKTSIIKKHRLNVKIIKNNQNICLAKAHNLALKTVKTAYCLLLSPNIILEDNSIANLLESSRNNKDAAIIAPVIYNQDGTIKNSFRDNIFKSKKLKQKPCINPEIDLASEYVSGDTMLLKMKYLKKIGFFDEDILSFYENDDLCLRSNANGYYNIVSANSHVKQLSKEASFTNLDNISLENKYMMWSRLYLEEKHHDKHKAKFQAFIAIYSNVFKLLYYTFTCNANKADSCKSKAYAAYSYFLNVKIDDNLK